MPTVLPLLLCPVCTHDLRSGHDFVFIKIKNEKVLKCKECDCEF